MAGKVANVTISAFNDTKYYVESAPFISHGYDIGFYSIPQQTAYSIRLYTGSEPKISVSPARWREPKLHYSSGGYTFEVGKISLRYQPGARNRKTKVTTPAFLEIDGQQFSLPDIPSYRMPYNSLGE